MRAKRATATAPTVTVRETAQGATPGVYQGDDYANYNAEGAGGPAVKQCPRRGGRNWQQHAVLEVLGAPTRDELAALSKREIAMRTGLSLRSVDAVVSALVAGELVELVVRGGSGVEQLGTLGGRRTNVYKLTPAGDDLAARRAWRRRAAWVPELANVLRGAGVSECAMRLVYAAYLSRRSDDDALAWARFDRFVAGCYGLARSTVADAMRALERVGLIATARRMATGERYPRSGAVAQSGSKLRRVTLLDELAPATRTRAQSSTPAPGGVATPAPGGVDPRARRTATPAPGGPAPYDRSPEPIREQGVARAHASREAAEVLEAIVAAHGSPPAGISDRDLDLAARAVEAWGLRGVVAGVTFGVAAKPKWFGDPKRPSLRWPSSLLRPEALAELVPLGLDALPDDVRELEASARRSCPSPVVVPLAERAQIVASPSYARGRELFARESRPAFAAAGGAS